MTQPDLEQMGLTAGRQVAGPAAIEQVAVESGVDAWDRPAYRFTYLFDSAQTEDRPGKVYIRIVQALQDELESRGDEHIPLIKLLDRTDWDKRDRA